MTKTSQEDIAVQRIIAQCVSHDFDFYLERCLHSFHNRKTHSRHLIQRKELILLQSQADGSLDASDLEQTRS